MRSKLCWITLGLWIVTIVVAGWFFVRGWTTPGTDGRMQVLLAPAERNLILGEMRMLLKAVHGVVTGFAGQDQEADRTQVEQAAPLGWNGNGCGREPGSHGEVAASVQANGDVDS